MGPDVRPGADSRGSVVDAVEQPEYKQGAPQEPDEPHGSHGGRKVEQAPLQPRCAEGRIEAADEKGRGERQQEEQPPIFSM